MYTPSKSIMYVGGTWGDAIYFQNKEKTRVYGFKGRGNTFLDGSVLFDLANNKNNDTIPLYYISNIEWKDDPRDMFFADISLIGNVKNPCLEEYDNDWYKEPLKELIDQYEKQINDTWFFEFFKRSRLQKYRDIMKLMLEAKPYVYRGFV